MLASVYVTVTHSTLLYMGMADSTDDDMSTCLCAV